VPASVQQSARRLSVLIADDNPDMVATLSCLLADHGHVVKTCLNGKEALHSIERFRPDVCIIDIVMPDLSGYDIAQEVQNLRLQPRPVMIAISGRHTESSDMLRARQLGFDHYFTKGADPNDVVRLLDVIAGD
jgi:CheY-like chemotaxis protein